MSSAGSAIDLGYWSFALSVYGGASVDDAIDCISGRRTKTGRPRYTTDPEDVAAMVRLKAEGRTYKEIGEIYGISDQAVYKRIARAMGKNN